MNISVPWRLHELVKRDANGSVSAHVLSILEAHYGRKFDELFIEDAQTIGYREVVEEMGLHVCNGAVPMEKVRRIARAIG